MIDSHFPELTGRTIRDARAALSRLEDENRAVRAELDLVLSSKARRVMTIAAHPLWALRATLAMAAGWKPLGAARTLWMQLRVHRTSLSSAAPFDTDGRLDAAHSSARWLPDLRIAGERREALLCDSNSTFVFQAPAGRGARLRLRCAIMPEAHDRILHGITFAATVRSTSADPPWERSASRLLRPWHWRDRRWRPITVELPDTAGEVSITIETRSSSAGQRRDAIAVWGDPAIEWPRTIGERSHLIRGAFRRLRWAGLGDTLAYARGRDRLQDQSSVYARWIERHRLDEADLERLKTEVAALPYQPLISVITPAYNTAPEVLTACIESVRRQAYPNWELCLADDGSTSAATRDVLQRSSGDPRVRVVRLDRNLNIAAASNAALRLASGEFVALLDHDDELAPEALAEVVRCLNAHRDADVIYSDEDKLESSGGRSDPYFKPDWSPDLFLSYMYMSHLTVVRRALVEEAGGFRTGFEGAQDYDLLLRLIEKTDRIQHIPRILYHWRKTPGSTATGGEVKPWALDAGRRALEESSARSGLEAEVSLGPSPGMYRVRRAVRNNPLVSIVVPTTGRPRAQGDDLVARCLRSLHRTAWGNFDVLVAADLGYLTDAARGALGGLRHRVVAYEPRSPFNFSHKINAAVRETAGSHVVLFNDDLEVIESDWLTAMLEHSQDRTVGAVGAKLLYPDGRLQHIGMLLGVCGIAAHAFHRQPAASPGYFGSAVVTRNCSAVTAACLMTRREVFDEAGGLDENLPVDFNDVDFCLRVRRAGYRIVFTPYARLYHHESASFGRRLQNPRELALMRERWGSALDHDPYYNPNLSRNFSDYRIQL
jgi:GT2 family glycosyltransferase